jgi:hypothetical protein
LIIVGSPWVIGAGIVFPDDGISAKNFTEKMAARSGGRWAIR